MILKVKAGDNIVRGELSMEATKDDGLERNIESLNKKRILKSCVIYNSGNFISGNDFLRLFENGIKAIKENFNPGRIDFHIDFMLKEHKMSYGFTFAECDVQEEYFYVYNEDSAINIFTRNYKEIEFKENCTCLDVIRKIRHDKLFLSLFNIVEIGGLEECREAYEYLTQHIGFYETRENDFNLAIGYEDMCSVYYDIDSKIHTSRLIDLVNKVNDNEKRNQVIGCAYNTKLMDSKIFRKDQINFVSQQKLERIFRLPDIKAVKDTNIEDVYLRGNLDNIINRK